MTEEHTCQCKVAGHCPRYGRYMVDREIAICNGTSGLSSAKAAKYLASWEAAKTEVEELPSRGLGDGISKIIKKVTGKKPCLPCKQRAAKINNVVPSSSYKNLETSEITLADSVRHLIFFMFPVGEAHEWIWRRQLERLALNKDIFNGRIKIRYVLGGLKDGTRTVSRDDLEKAVLEYLPSAELTHYENSVRLREVVGFTSDLNSLESLNPNEFICIAHAKGIQYANKESVVHNWTDIMYETVLEDWERAISCLDVYGISGSFKRYGNFASFRNHRWHYSGTFYWLRSASLFRRNWAHVDQRFWGMESYPGSHFRPKEGACLFMDNTGDLYKPECFKLVQKELESWRTSKPEIPRDALQYEEQMKSWGVHPIWTK